jgi:hypothetical protein
VENSTTQERKDTSRGPGPTGRDSSGGGDLADQAGDVMTGMTDSIRKNPMTCLMIGLGLGFVVARMFKR